jgi:hypothetical protein
MRGGPLFNEPTRGSAARRLGQPRIRRSKASKIGYCLQPLFETEEMPSFVLILMELNNFPLTTFFFERFLY